MVVAAVLYGLFCWYLVQTGFLQVLGWSKLKIIAAFSAKLLATGALFFIYTYYYTDRSTSDVYKFYADASYLTQLAKKAPLDYFSAFFGGESLSPTSQKLVDQMVYWEKVNAYGLWNDNRLLIRVNSILQLLTGSSLFASSLLLSLVNFWTMLLLYVRMRKTENPTVDWLYLALFFSPNILIWTSGLLKESLVVSGVALSCYFYFSTAAKIRMLTPLGLILVLLAKPQIGLFLLLALVLFELWKLFSGKWKRFVYPASLVVGLALIWLNSILTSPAYHRINGNSAKAREARRISLSSSYEDNVLNEGWSVLEKLKFKQLGYRVEARKEHAGSYIALHQLDGTFSSFLVALPGGMLNAFFRPFLWEARNPLMLLPAVENFLLLLLVFFLVYRRFSRSPLPVFRDEPLLLFFILISAVFIGILVPLLGNLIRYKVAFLPLLYIFLLRKITTEKQVLPQK